MLIRLSLHADIGEGYRRVPPIPKPYNNTLVDNAAVALHAAQGIAKRPGGRQHVIEQPDFAQIEIKREMESEEVVLQDLCCQRKKPDLAFHAHARAPIVNLLRSQS